MIRFENVNKTFRTDFWARSFSALKDLSFQVHQGDLVGFLGANGAGKTTSIKILLKFIREDSGNIIYDGKLGNNIREVFSNIGYIPERPYFYPHLTGREFVTYMGKLNDVSHALITERTNKWAERFLIAHALDRKVRGYSKGMLQRLGFVSALVHDPMFLLLDEPLSGLDPVGRKEIKDAMVELNKVGKTIFFSSHIVSDVEEICNKVVFIEKGTLIYEGAIDKLIEENIKPSYSVKLESGNFEIKTEEKEKFLKDALEKGDKVFSVALNRPTLEEIIYKIRS